MTVEKKILTTVIFIVITFMAINNRKKNNVYGNLCNDENGKKNSFLTNYSSKGISTIDCCCWCDHFTLNVQKKTTKKINQSMEMSNMNNNNNNNSNNNNKVYSRSQKDLDKRTIS